MKTSAIVTTLILSAVQLVTYGAVASMGFYIWVGIGGFAYLTYPPLVAIGSLVPMVMNIAAYMILLFMGESGAEIVKKTHGRNILTMLLMIPFLFLLAVWIVGAVALFSPGADQTWPWWALGVSCWSIQIVTWLIDFIVSLHLWLMMHFLTVKSATYSQMSSN